jgi:hypothetical protein
MAQLALKACLLPAVRKARHVRTHEEYSYPCTARTLYLNRLVTLPPGKNKARQGPPLSICIIL